MNHNELIKVLENNEHATLRILLPSGVHVPKHFHITEVGRIQKDFIDCGGTIHKNIFCLLQAWYSHDIEHRLLAGKLAKILKLSEKVLGTDDLPVEVEYGIDVVAQYALANVQVTKEGLTFILEGKKTDCLAPDKCGIKANNCCETGCC